MKADIRAANAAEDAIDYGAWQMVFNVLGLAGLGATVIYARRAWLSAEGSEGAAVTALRHTEDATRGYFPRLGTNERERPQENS